MGTSLSLYLAKPIVHISYFQRLTPLIGTDRQSRRAATYILTRVHRALERIQVTAADWTGDPIT